MQNRLNIQRWSCGKCAYQCNLFVECRVEVVFDHFCSANECPWIVGLLPLLQNYYRVGLGHPVLVNQIKALQHGKNRVTCTATLDTMSTGEDLERQLYARFRDVHCAIFAVTLPQPAATVASQSAAEQLKMHPFFNPSIIWVQTDSTVASTVATPSHGHPESILK